MAVPYLKFEPEDILTILLNEEAPAQAKLRVTNASKDHVVVFKVKTTKPERYLVKPNHGIVAKSGVIDVAIVLVNVKKQDLLARVKLHGLVKSQDKFLLLSAPIDDLVASQIEGSQADVVNKINHVLGYKDKQTIASNKFHVEFAIPEDDAGRAYREGGSTNKRAPGWMHLGSLNPAHSPGTPEGMFSEIVILRKKYDDLVAFTVNLTAERDMLLKDIARAKGCSDNTQAGAGAGSEVTSVENLTHTEIRGLTKVFLIAGTGFAIAMLWVAIRLGRKDTFQS